MSLAVEEVFDGVFGAFGEEVSGLVVLIARSESCGAGRLRFGDAISMGVSSSREWLGRLFFFLRCAFQPMSQGAGCRRLLSRCRPMILPFSCSGVGGWKSTGGSKPYDA